MKYLVHEIFYSLQGEGLWTGRPTIFVRFNGCNLKCNFCDTPQTKGQLMTEKEIVNKIELLRPVGSDIWVTLTGGEPMLQINNELLMTLRRWPGITALALETNGTIPMTDAVKSAFSWIAVSPKYSAPLYLEYFNEIRVPYMGREFEYWIKKLESHPGTKTCVARYVSPVNDGRDINWERVKEAREFVEKNPGWMLNMQMHKLIGIR